jgi:hypothetical protein
MKIYPIPTHVIPAFTKELFSNKAVAPSIRPELKSLFYNKARDVRNSGIISAPIVV